MSAHNHSEIWLAAISKAEKRKRNDSTDALDYLLHLKTLLLGGPDQSNRASWNEPPNFAPPLPVWENTISKLHQYGQLKRDMLDSDALIDEIASSMPMLSVNNQSNNRTAYSNHYSVLHGESDDDEVSDEEIVYHPPSSGQTNRSAAYNATSTRRGDDPLSSETEMSIRRILLRVYCSLAEIHSSWAVECSKSRKWTDGADEFENAFTTLRCGQEIIDEEHAWIAQIMETISLLDQGNSKAVQLKYEMNERQKCVDLDSEVVSVPLAFFSVSKEKYMHAAQSRIAYLESKLYENNASREDIMAKMGSRWKNNPHPSNDYASRRKALEKELGEAIEGMNRTQRMDVVGMHGQMKKGGH
ncbi:hypothetical protein HJC23_012318 [Cyclotella cryptica]|uniref:HMG box domain-containing protein n=1 Tax=Cyclotella cryptica TaxID=29204 RepID=A0ABD3QCD5_9STRA|eukprot:CCRYP_006505-RA/>CCRYP_006505-RA protein AED:0.23 eAED:0.23 QI:0/-1/0/1/-1/1/1/0/356